MADKYIIIGCGGHAKSILDVILFNEPNADVIFLDENAKENETIQGFSVLKDYEVTEEKIIVGIGDNTKRRLLSEKYCDNLTSIVSKDAYIGLNVKIGSGVFVGHKAIININSVIEDFAVINTSAIIEHDCIICKGTFVGPNSTLCGKVTIGENSFIGASVTVNPNVSIDKNITIGSKSLVVKNIDTREGNLFLGIPARPNKREKV